MQPPIRATALTRQLMALGRPEPVNPTTQDLGDVVSALGSVLRRLVDESVQLTIETERDVLIEADRSQLEQLVLNLVVNARDAIEPHGTIAVRVLETSGDTGALATIEVEDDGCGISPEHRTRLFEPFFTTKVPGRGTGLGLATVYTVVDRLGGTITLDSELGTGTKFGIHLPITDRGKILVRVLREAGADVIAAADGVEALKVRLEDVDVVVSDVVMPQMGGPELIEEIRRIRPDLPALLMTGYADGKSKARSGEVDVLTKPFVPAALVRAVRHAIASRAADVGPRATG